MDLGFDQNPYPYPSEEDLVPTQGVEQSREEGPAEGEYSQDKGALFDWQGRVSNYSLRE